MDTLKITLIYMYVCKGVDYGGVMEYRGGNLLKTSSIMSFLSTDFPDTH